MHGQYLVTIDMRLHKELQLFLVHGCHSMLLLASLRLVMWHISA